MHVSKTGQATFTITTEAIVTEWTFSRRKAKLLLCLSLFLERPALKYYERNISRCVIAGRPCDHELILHNACHVTQNELGPCCSVSIIISNLYCHVKGCTTSLCFDLNLNHWQTLWVQCSRSHKIMHTCMYFRYQLQTTPSHESIKWYWHVSQFPTKLHCEASLFNSVLDTKPVKRSQKIKHRAVKQKLAECILLGNATLRHHGW